MKKETYSLILSEQVISEIDKAAKDRGTSRSGLINQILAEYVRYVTPEMQMHSILSLTQEMLCSCGEYRVVSQPGGTMLSVLSALEFKYNPSVRYSVELYRNTAPFTGELRVSLRTQNGSLLVHITRFYRLWSAAECSYRPDCQYSIDGGRYTRRLRLPDGKRAASSPEELISGYISGFDRALKSFFADLDNPDAASAVEQIYRDCILGRGITV